MRSFANYHELFDGAVRPSHESSVSRRVDGKKLQSSLVRCDLVRRELEMSRNVTARSEPKLDRPAIGTREEITIRRLPLEGAPRELSHAEFLDARKPGRFRIFGGPSTSPPRLSRLNYADEE
jgi:hypothetical protein